MANITSNFLKLFIGTLIFGCVALGIFVTPNFEKTDSVMSSEYSYNLIPYINNKNQENFVASNISNHSILDTYYGTITAYGPDCAGCSGITASGYKVAENINGVITSTTITYIDETFGELRILASANSFPFGTVMRISGDRIDEYIMGIVLDRGGAMNNAWGDGEVLIDLLFATEKSSEVYEFGRQKNVKFEVLRYGR